MAKPLYVIVCKQKDFVGAKRMYVRCVRNYFDNFDVTTHIDYAEKMTLGTAELVCKFLNNKHGKYAFVCEPFDNEK